MNLSKKKKTRETNKQIQTFTSGYNGYLFFVDDDTRLLAGIQVYLLLLPSTKLLTDNILMIMIFHYYNFQN